MKAYEIINQRVNERGIPVAELARRTGTNSELLRRSLNGDRKLNIDEFLPLCKELGLSLDDFACIGSVA